MALEEGVGPDTAATLMIVAGDNPERLRRARPPSHTSYAVRLP